MELAGSPGPHVFVDSLDTPSIDEDDLHHLQRVLRVRAGDLLTASDGKGRWRLCTYTEGSELSPEDEIVEVAPTVSPTTVAFSLVKGQKPELVVQKLTELGVDAIVVMDAERSVVRWDDAKIGTQRARWQRIIREAAMQSHRVRLPSLDAMVPSVDLIAHSDVSIAQFGGGPITPQIRAIAIGPEGGWSPTELVAAGSRTVNLGRTVLRSETAAIAAGTLLSATPPS